MSEEGKDGEELTPIEPGDDGKITLEKDSEGKYPKVVPWGKHVAAKETIGRKLQASEEKVKSLEEKLKGAPNAEEHTRIKGELDAANAKLKEKEDEATKASEKSISEMREALKDNKAFTEEELGKMTEVELRAAVKAAGGKPKSKPDLSGGGGGGGGVPTGTPMQLARQAYESSSKK